MDWNAVLYDKEHDFVSNYGRDLIEVLNPKAGEHILDLGCGTGDLAHQLSLAGCMVTGIDSSEQMIEEAKKKYEGIEFACTDARDFEMNDRYDAVFSNAVLHWIKDQDAVLENIFYHLKSGGRIVAELGAKGNVEKIRTELKKVLKKHGFTTQAAISNWYFPSVAEYADKLEQYGFEIRFIENYDRPTPLKSTDNGIVDWLEMFGGSFFEGIDEINKTKILYEVQENLKHDLYKNGVWIADYRRLRFWAEKNKE